MLFTKLILDNKIIYVDFSYAEWCTYNLVFIFYILIFVGI